MSNIKYFKNPERDKPEKVVSQHIPFYQSEGIEPIVHQVRLPSKNTAIAKPSPINPRMNVMPKTQPYAETSTSLGNIKLPNVGNSMEHSWSSSIDGNIIADDLPTNINQNQQMIDNNDSYSEEALNLANYQPVMNAPIATGVSEKYRTGPLATELQSQPQGTVIIENPPQIQKVNDSSNLLDILTNLNEDYLLIISEVPVCTGPKEEVEELAKAFVFGEHQLCDGNPTPIEDVVIVKKVKIKVGVFLD